MKSFKVKPVIMLALFLTAMFTTTRSQDINSATQLTRSEQYDKAEEMLKKMIQNEPTNHNA